MTKSLFFALSLAAATTSASLLHAVPAAAQPSPSGAMAAPNVDCSKASSMMSSATKMDQTPTAMTGDVDKDFRAMMMAHDKPMMMVAQVEAQCGKNPQLKAAASKLLQDASDRLEMFRNQGQS